MTAVGAGVGIPFLKMAGAAADANLYGEEWGFAAQGASADLTQGYRTNKAVISGESYGDLSGWDEAAATLTYPGADKYAFVTAVECVQNNAWEESGLRIDRRTDADVFEDEIGAAYANHAHMNWLSQYAAAIVGGDATKVARFFRLDGNTAGTPAEFEFYSAFTLPDDYVFHVATNTASNQRAPQNFDTTIIDPRGMHSGAFINIPSGGSGIYLIVQGIGQNNSFAGPNSLLEDTSNFADLSKNGHYWPANGNNGNGCLIPTLFNCTGGTTGFRLFGNNHNSWGGTWTGMTTLMGARIRAANTGAYFHARLDNGAGDDDNPSFASGTSYTSRDLSTQLLNYNGTWTANSWSPNVSGWYYLFAYAMASNGTAVGVRVTRSGAVLLNSYQATTANAQMQSVGGRLVYLAAGDTINLEGRQDHWVNTVHNSQWGAILVQEDLAA